MNILVRNAWGFIVLLVLISLGCTYKEYKQQTSTGPTAQLYSTYQSIYSNIIQPKCITCHSGQNAPHGIDLTSYRNIMDSSVFPPLVVPFDPESSSIFNSVFSGEMPKNGAKLSDQELQVIYEWIKTGAPEFEGPILSPSPPEN